MPKELFQRNYLVRISDIGTNGELTSLEIRPPFNMSFECQRLTKKANSLNITLYGLGEKKRVVLSKRSYEDSTAFVIENGELKSEPVNGLKKQNLDQFARRLQIELFICYGDNSNLQRIFVGEIRQVNSTLGSTGFETKIEAMSNLLFRQKAFTSRTVTNREEAIKKLMADSGLTVGKIELVNSAYLKPKVLRGNSFQLLRDMADGVTEKFYEDDGKGYFIPVNTQASNRVIPVSAGNGLLNTPSREAEFINFKNMISPSFKPDSIIEVESFVDPTVNGQYEIFDIVYIGEFEGVSWTVDILARAIGETLLIR